MTKVQIAQKRVNKGVKFLDEKFGRSKWLKKIDLSTLRLQSESQCVCGQLFGGFWNAVNSSYGEHNPGKLSLFDSRRFGFSLPHTSDLKSKDPDGINYDLLQGVWFCKINDMKK